MADDAPEVPDDLDDEALDDSLVDAAMIYEAQTARLRVYSSLIRATLPPIGRAGGYEQGSEIEVNPDVRTYREFALAAIFADIRRIAGEGIDVKAAPEDAR